MAAPSLHLITPGQSFHLISDRSPVAVALLAASFAAVESSLRLHPTSMSVHLCVHCDIRFGGTNLVLLHVSAAVCVLLGSGCCGFFMSQRMQLQPSRDAYAVWHTPLATIKQRANTRSAVVTLRLIRMTWKGVISVTLRAMVWPQRMFSADALEVTS